MTKGGASKPRIVASKKTFTIVRQYDNEPEGPSSAQGSVKGEGTYACVRACVLALVRAIVRCICERFVCLDRSEIDSQTNPKTSRDIVNLEYT